MSRGADIGPPCAGATALLAALFAAKLGVALWGVDRGFDLGDEGFFLLILNDPEQAPPLFGFYRLLTLLDPMPRFDVAGARLLRIAVELAATLALALGAWRFARRRLPGAAELGVARFLAVGLLGALLSVAARVFGYNDATNLLTYAATGALLALLAGNGGNGDGPCTCNRSDRSPDLRVQGPSPISSGRGMLWCGLAGLLLGVQLFVKFPATLLLAACTALLVLGIVRAPLRARLALLAYHGLGIAAAALAFTPLYGGLDGLRDAWAFAAEVNRVTGYGVREILTVYVHHDLGSHVNGAAFAATFAVALAAAHRVWRGATGALDRALLAALGAGVAVLAFGAWRYHAHNIHPLLIVLFCSLLLLAAVQWGLAWRRWPTGRPGRAAALVPLLLLLALPFAAMAGTNVALTLRLPSHAAPLFLLLAALQGPLRRGRLRRFAAASLALLALVSSAVFAAHHVQRPYGLPSPLYRQRYETPHLPGLRVDLPTRVFVDGLVETMAAVGFEPGDPVIALDFMPGLVHLLGARSPGFPFFNFARPAFNCWAIARARLDRTPFLILGQEMSLEQHACIEAFDYPDDFRHVRTLANPYARAIPYFFGGPEMPYVHVLAPSDGR